MTTVYDVLTSRDLMFALFEHGGDAMIIDDEETATEVAEFLNEAEFMSEIDDDRAIDPINGRFAVAMRQLGIAAGDDAKHIYSFVHGSAGTVCFYDDLIIKFF